VGGGLNGVRITIYANDGWFILPIPFAAENHMGLTVIEQNAFRNNERIILFSGFQEGEFAGMAGIFLANYSLMLGLSRQTFTEYTYKDGGYNARNFGRMAFGENPDRFGEISNQYDKELRQSRLSVGFRYWTALKVRWVMCLIMSNIATRPCPCRKMTRN